MNKQKIIRKLAIAATLLMLSGMVSCIGMCTSHYTIIDLGGGIGNIGKQVAHLQEGDCTATYCVQKKNGLYYVQLPLVYLPADESVFIHSCGFTWPPDNRKKLECTWPDSVTQEDILSARPEYYVAILSKEQYDDACRWIKFDFSLFGKKLAGKSHKVLPMADVDLNGAELILDSRTATAFTRRPQLWRVAKEAPPRRTWYNYTLLPLSWAAEVVDIPLSLIATPIGWLADAIYEPLAN